MRSANHAGRRSDGELGGKVLAGPVEHTIASRAHCTGVGLHSGRPVGLTLRPAAPGTGILFERTDCVPVARFPARAEWVVDTTLATTLGSHDYEARLSTVEHLLAALRALGVDNCTVEVSGAELPVMDGSAAPFVYLIQQAGLRAQSRGRRTLVIRRPIEVRDGDRWVRVIPSREFKLSVSIDYAHSAIRRQTIESFRVSARRFARELAPARTFGFLEDVRRLRARGLSLGGSLQNAIVLDEVGVLNRGGLRFPDEFVRHKALDLIGDLSLLGLPLRGHVKAMRGGHRLHRALVSEIRANPSCWSVEVPDGSRRPEPQPARPRLPARIAAR